MASYIVNIAIGAGAEFYQEFTMTEVDFSPMSLVDLSARATLAKHSNSVDVVNSTSDLSKKNVVVFETMIADADNGIISIYMNASKTRELEEGKYVYSVVVKNEVNDIMQVVSGLAFVTNVIGDQNPDLISNPIPGNDGWSDVGVSEIDPVNPIIDNPVDPDIVG